MENSKALKLCLALSVGVGFVAPPRVGAVGAAPSYISKSEGYAVWMPGQPKIVVKKANMPGLGAVTIRSAAVQVAPLAYVVVPTPLPAGYKPAYASRILDGIQSGFLSSSGGKLISSRSIKLGAYSGREVVIAMGAAGKNARMRGRFFVTPRRTFQVMALGPTAALESKKAQVQKVLGSFQIL